MQMQSCSTILFLSTISGVELKVFRYHCCDSSITGAKIEVWLINYLLVELVNARLDIPYYRYGIANSKVFPEFENSGDGAA